MSRNIGKAVVFYLRLSRFTKSLFYYLSRPYLPLVESNPSLGQWKAIYIVLMKDLPQNQLVLVYLKNLEMHRTITSVMPPQDQWRKAVCTHSLQYYSWKCPTLCDSMDCSLSHSSVHGILQVRVLEWVAISFSRGSSWPGDWTWVSCIAGRFLTNWATREAQQIIGNDLSVYLWILKLHAAWGHIKQPLQWYCRCILLNMKII